MGWVRRDAQNKVCEWARQPAAHLTEELPETNAEVIAYLAAPGGTLDKDAECRKAIDADPANSWNVDLYKVIKAVAISNLAARLGKNPGALTNAELAAERNRIAAIYAAL